MVLFFSKQHARQHSESRWWGYVCLKPNLSARFLIAKFSGIQQAGGDVDQDEVVLPRQTDGDQFEPLNKEGLDRDHQVR